MHCINKCKSLGVYNKKRKTLSPFRGRGQGEGVRKETLALSLSLSHESVHFLLWLVVGEGICKFKEPGLD